MATCGNCGAEYEHRQPDGTKVNCPACGSDSPTSIHPVPPAQLVAKAVFPHHWIQLLQNAQRQFDGGEYSVAVIIAQTACEVIVERAMTQGFDALKVPQLKKWVLPEKVSGNIEDPGARKRYKVLTGDNTDFGKEPFWTDYAVMVDARNAAVHRGKGVTKGVAERGLDAAKLLVAHVESHNGLK